MVEAIVLLVVVGVALWLLNTYVPMAPPIKTVVNVLVVLLLLLWILRGFGIIHDSPTFHP